MIDDVAVPKSPDLAISIVMVTYNCASYISTTLESIGNQLDGLQIEIIIVDNGSSDSTVQQIREYSPDIRLLEAKENFGFAWACNRGMELATGSLLLFLNPDTKLPKTGLKEAAARLTDSPTVGVLGCRLECPDGSPDHAAKRGFPTIASSLGYFTKLYKVAPRVKALSGYLATHISYNQEGLVDAVNGAFMLVKRQAAEAVGPLDETYWMYGEDLDWFWRFRTAGWQILYWPGMTVVHIKGGSTPGPRGLKLNFSFYRAMWLFYSRHPGKSDPWVLKVIVAAGIGILFSFSAIRSALIRKVRPGRHDPDEMQILKEVV